MTMTKYLKQSTCNSERGFELRVLDLSVYVWLAHYFGVCIEATYQGMECITKKTIHLMAGHENKRNQGSTNSVEDAS